MATREGGGTTFRVREGGNALSECRGGSGVAAYLPAWHDMK